MPAPGRPLCHHVLLALVEAHLAERDGAHRHVDGGGDEAVDAHLVVESVDVLRRVLTAGHRSHSGHTQTLCFTRLFRIKEENNQNRRIFAARTVQNFGFSRVPVRLKSSPCQRN